MHPSHAFFIFALVFQIDNVNGGQPCTGADQLPAEFEALLSCQVEKKAVWNCQRNPRAVPLK